MGKLVFLNNNRPMTDSLIVADSFVKRHDRVLQDIRDLGCSPDFRLHHFVESSYTNQQGRTMPKVDMTQQGFTLLAMGYTGQRAMEFKEQYIAEFDRMRDELIKPQLALPQSYVEALKALVVSEEQKALIEADNERLAIETAEQQRKLKEQEAPVAIYNLAISAQGTMSMQEVAKSFGTGRTRLYNILREESVVMKGSTLPYQRFLDAGYFKVVERPRANGDLIKNDPATRVTAKGFEYIGKIFRKRAERNEEEKA